MKKKDEERAMNEPLDASRVNEPLYTARYCISRASPAVSGPLVPGPSGSAEYRQSHVGLGRHGEQNQLGCQRHPRPSPEVWPLWWACDSWTPGW